VKENADNGSRDAYRQQRVFHGSLTEHRTPLRMPLRTELFRRFRFSLNKLPGRFT
jgi:hypothetical protein